VPPRILGVDATLFGGGVCTGLVLAVTLGPGLVGWLAAFAGWVALHGALIRLSREDVLGPFKLLRYAFTPRVTPPRAVEEEVFPWTSRLFA
jgi:hypothetical protein